MRVRKNRSREVAQVRIVWFLVDLLDEMVNKSLCQVWYLRLVMVNRYGKILR